MLVNVAVFAPLRDVFTYRWPEHLGEPVAGIRVRVPLGRGTRLGLVRSVTDTLPLGLDKERVLDVIDRLDCAPCYDERRTRWLERLQRYYLAPEGEVWEMALSWALSRDAALLECPRLERLPKQFKPLEAAWHGHRRALKRETVIARVEVPHANWLLDQALRLGVIELRRGGSAVKVQPIREAPHALTARQAGALQAIMAAGETFAPFLLFGCTGSGKTEVYLQAASRWIEQGRQVLVLVPEIGLTPMWLQRVCSRFGSSVGVWHSGLSQREKWSMISRLDEIDVLVGTRSALFLPLPRLAMIVVDEEHDASFKQQEGVRYSARDAAVLLAQELGIPIVLGSATPSLESWRLAKEGQYRLLKLPERIAAPAPPEPEIIDLRSCDQEVLISPQLAEAMQKVLNQGEQMILFLNRRGFAPALQCCSCGHIAECPHCSMRLTLHRRVSRLRCHFCNYARKVTPACDACGESELLPLGEGTERIEDWLSERFPAYRFARFDRDSVRSMPALQEVLQEFSKGRIHGLIGTQMLVKGHHFPNVTLVGVLNADLGMGLPDFRAGERWWQQMVQVMGRCGRGEQAGRVLIQTRMPDAVWLKRLCPGREQRVLDDELQLRRALGFPPYARWVRLVFSSRRHASAWGVAESMGEILRKQSKQWDVDLVGPMNCPIERLAGCFRVELMVRDGHRQSLPWKLAPLLEHLDAGPAVRVQVDVDPYDLM